MSSALHELGMAVRARRAEIGLTQAELARLSQVSRSTINQVETNNLKNLSIIKAAQVLQTLGLSLGVSGVRQPSKLKRRPASIVAAQSASVSYKTQLPPVVLRRALRTGNVPENYKPHMRVFFDELPLSLLAGVVDEVAGESEDMARTRRSLWQRMRSIAQSLGCQRAIWT